MQFIHPSTKKNLHGGCFKVKEEAEARARELAKELGLQEEVVPVKPLSEIPHFEPLGLEKGIKWVPSEQAWRVRYICSGKEKGLEAGGGLVQAAGEGKGAGGAVSEAEALRASSSLCRSPAAKTAVLKWHRRLGVGSALAQLLFVCI